MSVQGWLIKEAVHLGLFLLGASGLVYVVIKRFGQKAIDHAFARSLATFQSGETQKLDKLKAEYAEALELVKKGHSVSLSRTAKLHDKEFDVLPEAWRLMVIAVSDAQRAMAMLTSSPDISRMGELQKADLFDAYEVRQWQRDEITGAVDPTRQLGKLLRTKALWTAKGSHAEGHNYLLELGVFIGEPLISRMEEVFKYVGDALFDWEHMYDDWKASERGKHSRNVSSVIPDLLQEIKQGVRAHLRGEDLPSALSVPRTFPPSLVG